MRIFFLSHSPRRLTVTTALIIYKLIISGLPIKFAEFQRAVRYYILSMIHDLSPNFQQSLIM